MPVYCPECGGETWYDSSAKRHVCKSCGVMYTKEELEAAREKLLAPAEDEKARARRRGKEMLKWWLSSKSD